MRRYLFTIILLVATVLPAVVAYAQEPAGSTGVMTDFKALAPIPGLTGDATGKSTSVLSSNSLAEFFNNLYIYAIGMAAAIAVIQIIYAGLEIAFFNKDNVSKLMDSKGRIAQSIYGLILIFSPVVVFSIINPSILNLELNLQPLDTAPRSDAAPLGDAGKGILDNGKICTDNNQCSSRLCDFSAGEKNEIGEARGRCSQAVKGAQCSFNSQCVTNYCDTGGGPSGYCKDAPTETKILLDGAICQNDAQCPSKVCGLVGGTPTCVRGSNLESGADCNVDRQCKSNVCEFGFFGNTCK